MPSLRTTPIAAESLPPPRRRAPPPPGPLNDNPDVNPVMVDGSMTLAVGLSGRLGTGRNFLIDPADWHEVGATMGARWLVVDMRHQSYVASSRTAAAKHSSQGAKKPLLLLARWLMGAQHPWQNVRHRNGDTLDLRRCNLFIDDRAAEWATAQQRRETRDAALRVH